MMKENKEGSKTYGEKPISFEFENEGRFYIGSEVCMIIAFN